MVTCPFDEGPQRGLQCFLRLGLCIGNCCSFMQFRYRYRDTWVDYFPKSEVWYNRFKAYFWTSK